MDFFCGGEYGAVTLSNILELQFSNRNEVQINCSKIVRIKLDMFSSK